MALAESEAESPAIRGLLANPVQLAQWLHDRDPQLESAHAKVEAAEAAARQARVLPNPQLSLATGGYYLGAAPNDGNTPPRGLGLSDTTNFEIGVGELVEIGKRGPRRTAADLRIKEATAGAVGTLGSRVSDATTTLGKLAYVAARRDATAANLDAARKLEASEKTRLDHQDLSASEFARIQLDTADQELELGKAESELADALADCSATLYATCVATGLDQSALDAGAPLGDALPETETALEARPAREATRLEASALEWDATLAEKRRIPDPTVGVSYTFDNFTSSGNLHQQLVFSVGIPLAIFDRGDHDAAAARANAHALKAQERAELREAKGKVQALVTQRQSLLRRVKQLETDMVPKSSLIVEQTRKAFDLGQVRTADLLVVERQHRDYLLTALDTRFDLFNNRAQLRAVLGLDDAVARDADRRTP